MQAIFVLLVHEALDISDRICTRLTKFRPLNLSRPTLPFSWETFNLRQSRCGRREDGLQCRRLQITNLCAARYCVKRLDSCPWRPPTSYPRRAARCSSVSPAFLFTMSRRTSGGGGRMRGVYWGEGGWQLGERDGEICVCVGSGGGRRRRRWGSHLK